MIVVGPCSLVPLGVTTKDAKIPNIVHVRPANGGWKYYGCNVCRLRVWIAPGEKVPEFECRRPASQAS